LSIAAVLHLDGNVVLELGLAIGVVLGVLCALALGWGRRWQVVLGLGLMSLAGAFLAFDSRA
jgi:hypothetical protein